MKTSFCQPHQLLRLSSDWIIKSVIVGTSVIFVGSGCTPPDSTSPQTVAPSKTTSFSFTEVTAEAGLEGFRHVNGATGNKWFPETMGAGVGFLDYDGDGWQDIVLVGGNTWEKSTAPVRHLWLYGNNHDGTFTLRTDEAGLGRLPDYGFGVTVGDYDNDGDDDLFLTVLGPNRLLRNHNGVFTDVTMVAGLGNEAEWSTSALFFDPDRDGDLDLYVGNYVAWSPETDIFCSTNGERKGYCTPELYEGLPNRFYRNQGDGTFREASQAAGFSSAAGKTLGVVVLDFNRDGWPDLAVANDTDPDFLYQNKGDGTFEEKGVMSGIAFDERGRARAGMGIDAGVVDATGEETIFVGNFSNQMLGVYRHLGGSAFLDRAATSRIGRPSLLTLTFGLFLFDADLDGDLDLYAANGHVQPDIEQVKDNITFRQPSHLFINQGDGTFVDAAPDLGAPLTDMIVGRGAAYADYDRDGDLDVLVMENDGPVHLWRNDIQDARYFRVATQGQQSNRDGLGTQLVLLADGKRQERRIRTGSSFLSQSERVATFGLGQAQRVDSLLVFWPSGQVDRHANLEINQTVRVVEGSGVYPLTDGLGS